MTLIDTDANSFERSTPQPNGHDLILDGAYKAHKTLSSHYKTDADASVGYLQANNKFWLANDGTTNRFLIGYNATTATWGAFGSKSGSDVLTTSPYNYTFTTDYRSPKITDTGLITVSYTASTGAANNSATINGTLGIPIPFAFYVTDSNTLPLGPNYQLPYQEFNAAGALQLQILSAINYNGVSTTQFTVYVNIPTGSSYYASNKTILVRYNTAII